MIAARNDPSPNAAAILNLGGGQTAEARAALLARSLIGTRYYPPGFPVMRQIAMEAQAYHNLCPYPWWQFTEWKTEDRGPYPKCLPLARRIVQKGARWLFGKPTHITVPGNERLEAYFAETWQRNRMPTRMVAAAERGGYQGGLALKWSYDETADPALCFQVLSVIDECRLFYDPHDYDRLLMARVQYPVFNPEDGEMYLYREEWTDAEEVHYRPIRATTTGLFRMMGDGRSILFGAVPVVFGTKFEPDLYDKWEVTDRHPNPFGVIPLLPIRNADRGSTYGYGDLWTDVHGGMFRILDRINLTFHGMDKSNQFDSERNVVFLDVSAGQDQVDRPFAPGQPLSLKSDNMEGKQGQVIELEAGGQMRPHMMEYASELRQEILSTVGSVDVRHEEVTNKGNLTQAVLTQLYAPLIETTEEKRKTYGENGVAKFLELCAVGLQNAGVREPRIRGVNADRQESFDVQLVWPPYFAMTEEEKQAAVTRWDGEVTSGYLTHERALEKIAKIEDIEDLNALKEDMEDVGEAVRQRQIEGSNGAQDAQQQGQADTRFQWDDGD